MYIFLRSFTRCRTSIYLTCLLSMGFLVVQLLLQFWMEWTEDPYAPKMKRKYTFKDVNEFVLVWWTPFTGNLGSFLECGDVRCFVTQDRRFQYHPMFQMFLFYGSSIEISDLPLPRKNHTWSLLHEESPKNVPFLVHKKGISLFNFTATFSRFSDVPLTLQYIQNLQSITGQQYVVPLHIKNELLDHLSPILYVQSDCDTPLDRDNYVKNLMNYVSIDSYGACLNNKQLPASMANPMESFTSDDFLHFTAQYKFTIAFENAVCEDYITEKLWRPLTVGSVPIYLGSPSVQDWLPSPNSAILAADFSSPQDLARYILELNANDQKYLSFLSHKKGVTGIITNEVLKSEMMSRAWGLTENSNYHFVDHFECQMCLEVHRNVNQERRKVADQKDYLCPRPISSVNNQEDPNNTWLHLWDYSKCEASVLAELVEGGHYFINETTFNFFVESRFRKGNC